MMMLKMMIMMMKMMMMTITRVNYASHIILSKCTTLVNIMKAWKNGRFGIEMGMTRIGWL